MCACLALRSAVRLRSLSSCAAPSVGSRPTGGSRSPSTGPGGRTGAERWCRSVPNAPSVNSGIGSRVSTGPTLSRRPRTGPTRRALRGSALQTRIPDPAPAGASRTWRGEPHRGNPLRSSSVDRLAARNRPAERPTSPSPHTSTGDASTACNRKLRRARSVRVLGGRTADLTAATRDPEHLYVLGSPCRSAPTGLACRVCAGLEELHGLLRREVRLGGGRPPRSLRFGHADPRRHPHLA